MRYPVRILIPVLAILLALFWLPFLSVRFSAPDASILPKSVPSRAAYDFAQRFNSQDTTPMIMAVQTHGDVLTSQNISSLDAGRTAHSGDPRVQRVDSIVSADHALRWRNTSCSTP